MNNLVEQYLVFAEGQALQRIPMRMAGWIARLHEFLQINRKDILYADSLCPRSSKILLPIQTHCVHDILERSAFFRQTIFNAKASILFHDEFLPHEERKLLR